MLKKKKNQSISAPRHRLKRCHGYFEIKMASLCWQTILYHLFFFFFNFVRLRWRRKHCKIKKLSKIEIQKTLLHVSFDRRQRGKMAQRDQHLMIRFCWQKEAAFVHLLQFTWKRKVWKFCVLGNSFAGWLRVVINRMSLWNKCTKGLKNTRHHTNRQAKWRDASANSRSQSRFRNTGSFLQGISLHLELDKGWWKTKGQRANIFRWQEISSWIISHSYLHVFLLPNII